MLALNSHHPIQDIHFSLKGPVVGHLQEVFAEDWAFSTNEKLQGETWFPHLRREGSVTARGMNDGPDEDFDKLRLTLLGGLACAQQSIAIVNPYFLPDGPLITSLIIAAMRGIRVDIVLPDKNNLRLVQWASAALYWELLQRGCRIWASPPPFDHSKLVIVDRVWAFIGSANWDPRSFRLNFEFNVEVYNRELAQQLTEMVKAKIEKSRSVTYQEVEGRSLAIKLRDNVARLFSPYL